MWDKTKSWLSLIADVIAITFILPGAWRVVSEFFGDNIFCRVLAGIIFLLSVLIAIKFYTERYREFKSKFRQVQIREDVKAIGRQDAQRHLKAFLPPAKVIKRMIDETHYKAKQWAEDAISDGPNFYLKVTREKIDPVLQSIYYSPWKDLQLCLYEGHLTTDTLSEPYAKPPEDVLSFLNEKRWRRGVLKAYEKVKESLPSEYELIINSRQAETAISFSYKQGRVNRSANFTLRDGLLREESTGKAEYI